MSNAHAYKSQVSEVSSNSLSDTYQRVADSGVGETPTAPIHSQAAIQAAFSEDDPAEHSYWRARWLNQGRGPR